MKNFLLNIYNSLENSKYKVLILTLVFLFIVLLRNVLEIFNSVWYIGDFFDLEKFIGRYFFVISHWMIWYVFVFLIILSCVRYILKLPINKTLYFSLSIVVIILPIIISIIAQHPLNLAYLSYIDIPSLLKSVSTLFLFDQFNFVVFSEMLCLFIGFPIINYLVSKNIFRSLLAPFVVFFAVGLLGAFMYICPSERCLITNVTNFGPAFFPFYWIPLSFISLIIFVLPEAISFLKDNTFFNKKRIISAIFSYIPLFLFLLFFTDFHFYDVIFLSLSYFISYFVFLFLIIDYKKKKYFEFTSFLWFYFFIIFTPIIMIIVRTFYFIYRTGVINSALLS